MGNPKLPLSASTSYLSPAEFLKRVDVSSVGDLCADRPAGGGPAVRLTATQLLTDPNLQAALDDAAGELESACFVGNKYTPQDIQALVATPCVGRARLFRIITAIAKVLLVERRPGAKIPEEFLAGCERAQGALEALYEGREILSFQETEDAGLMDIEPVTPEDVFVRFGPVVQAQRYFGIRSNRVPGPGGW